MDDVTAPENQDELAENADQNPSEDGPPERAPASYGAGDPDPEMNEKLVEVLKTVFDPEIPVFVPRLEVTVHAGAQQLAELVLGAGTLGA